MWLIESSHASLDLSNLHCELELTQPQKGLLNTTAYQHSLAHSSFVQLHMGLDMGLDMRLGEESIQEAYQRGNDLIVQYQSTEQRNATPQLYWRTSHRENAVGIEIIVSLQTDQLDCRCPIRTSTSIASPLPVYTLRDSQQWKKTDGGECSHALLVQLTPTLTYLEVVHPTDHTTTSIRLDDQTTTWEHCLLNLPLEKGVIRRARMQSWWIQHDDSETLANEIVQAFHQSTPPLTT